VTAVAGRVEVRPAGPDDVDLLFDIRTGVRENHQSRAELAREDITPATLRAQLRGGEVAFVAWVDGVAAGFSWPVPATCFLWALFVRPAYEGRGLGRLLLARAEAHLVSHGCTQAWLQTSAEPGLRAHGFYWRMGWEEVGPVTAHEVRLVKTLARP
jgi:GNAT superfamily N-acetyltransferase